MKHRITAMAVLLGLFTCIQTGIAAGQARITQAQLGTGITPQFEIVNPTTEFTVDTPKIYCAWKTEGLKAGIPVRGVWIAEDVGKAARPNFKIDEASFTPPLGSASAGMFALPKPNKGFPVGKYRLEIYVENHLVKTLPFTVKAK